MDSSSDVLIQVQGDNLNVTSLSSSSLSSSSSVSTPAKPAEQSADDSLLNNVNTPTPTTIGTAGQTTGGRSANNTSPRLFIGGIGTGVNEGSFRDFFSQFGKLVDSVLIRDSRSHQRKGYGFIEFEKSNDADQLIEAHAQNKVNWEGQDLTIEFAKMKPQSHAATASSRGRSRSPDREGRRSERVNGRGAPDVDAFRIWIGGLERGVSDEDIRSYFHRFGAVIDVCVMNEKDDNSRPFAYLSFEKQSDMDYVLSRKHTIVGRPVDVRVAEPRRKRRDRSSNNNRRDPNRSSDTQYPSNNTGNSRHHHSPSRYYDYPEDDYSYDGNRYHHHRRRPHPEEDEEEQHQHHQEQAVAYHERSSRRTRRSRSRSQSRSRSYSKRRRERDGSSKSPQPRSNHKSGNNSNHNNNHNATSSDLPNESKSAVAGSSGLPGAGLPFHASNYVYGGFPPAMMGYNPYNPYMTGYPASYLEQYQQLFLERSAASQHCR